MRLITLLLLSILSLEGLSSSEIATITALKGSSTITRESDNIKAFLGAKLKQKDIIKTKEDSKVQIIFLDETIITIGKNSNFSIEEYLFEDTQTPVARFNIIKGAMKTITGKIGKIAPQKFSVKAKTSTIGIRGTNFVVMVQDNGSHQAYCTHGAISVTFNGETHIVKKGFFIGISTNGKVELKKFTSIELKSMEENSFGKNKTQKGKLSLDEGFDDSGDLDISFGEDSDMVIKDISDTLSDMDRTVEPTHTEDHSHGTHDNYHSPGYY